MNGAALKKPRPPVTNVVAAQPAPVSIPSDSVSEQVIALNAELLETLGTLNALIDNRSAWADAIEGCREGVALLSGAQTQLRAITESARRVESDLTSARAELERWSKMHADLSAVERDLRAECERHRRTHADLSAVERELRADCEKKGAALEKQATSLANARALAQEMVREIGP
jgi:chromosome segregation ATPase